MDPELEAQAMVCGLRPAPVPPGLRARALGAARREYRILDRWIGTVFRSRLFWSAWATAVLLALLVRPESNPTAGQPQSATAPVLWSVETLDSGRWLAPVSRRPRPTGPLLAEEFATPLDQGGRQTARRDS